MFQSSRHEQKASLQLKLPWDTNTARGFGISMSITILMILLSSLLVIDPPQPRYISINTIPIELLNFGEGDGTGLSRGNLTKEGKRFKGKKPASQLEDSQIKAKTKPKKNASDNPELAAKIIPVKKLGSDDNSKSVQKGSDRKNIGGADGDPMGRGIGEIGTGRGAGSGFGDIEWGGGGNRTVLSKHIPKFPKGVKTSAQIKLRFEVLPDGTVSDIIPLQKADPDLEKAAIEALRKWRFNPLSNDVVMIGIIPMTFMLR